MTSLVLYEHPLSPYAQKCKIALYEKGVPFERVRALHVLQDNTDVVATLTRLQAEQGSAFDPNRVQWRSDRLEWVIKSGFAPWFMEEVKTGRAFFPLPVTASA